ncbi:MAG: pyruvate formate lyase activating enzyme [Thermoanaerobacteraceae bacterium]|nr:pyruvate formate lyase activating enzyme [Thermoanaerobacteraceae bacterium]
MICDFIPVSVVDFPGNVAATVFVSGCNFRCPYCHNSSIIGNKNGFSGRTSVLPKSPSEEVINYLKRRKKLIDGVCITGGEPTLWRGLKEFITEIKTLGLKVKLDTNGSRPDVLKELIQEELIDYVAMDIKAPICKYRLFTLDERDILNVQKSAEVILLYGTPNGKIIYEFRTTVHEKILEPNDFVLIGEWLSGASKYVLQGYRYSPEVLDVNFCGTKPCDIYFLNRAKTVLSKYFKEILIRS